MNSFTMNPADSLNEENRATRALVDLLKKEQAQLVAADINGLPELMEEKNKLVSQLSELATRRHNALAAAGFEAKESGMQAWLKSATALAASKSWNDLMSLAHTAKELNRVNGMLIGKHLARNQQALNVLGLGAKGQTFYGPNGQSTVQTTVRGLAIG